MAFVPIYILILGFTILLDYFSGIFIEQAEGKKRKAFLIISLVSNIGVLAVFKYYNFFIDNITVLATTLNVHHPLPYISIILPIGLSFHTFQALSYTIEVYRGNQKAEKHLGIYALYVMFYPQLVAGPIERPQNLLNQFREKFPFEYARVVKGLEQILWGLFKKLVVADRLAIYVDIAYNNPEQHSSPTLILATFFFAIQIYCDFSGYSDIAIGAARVMGFKLMTNFNRPYFAKNISEFWKRWHISLSTWFKDYLYISLGGNRVSIPRWYLNLMIVFLISGLWHGANWTFLIWGSLNGVFLILSIRFQYIQEKISRKIHSKMIRSGYNALQIILTFTAISFSWIFFRSNNFNDSKIIIEKIFKYSGSIFIESPSMLIYSLLGIIILFTCEYKMEYSKNTFKILSASTKVQRYVFNIFLIICILMFGVFDGGQFIYFQF